MATQQDFKTAVFGPLKSRRLGNSLGVGLLPYKTCSHDCIYCECGATTCLTTERKSYYPVETIPAQIDAVIAKNVSVDYVTFSGMGEPTLQTGLNVIIDHVKNRNCGIRTCLLTNASELHRKEVRSELKNLDLIVPSLDGSNEEEFRLINRPHKDVTLAKTVEGCITFRKEYPAIEMWLEVFIVPGINDTPESLPRFVELFRQIKPDKIQLNSLDRRGAVDWIQVPAREDMEKIADCFQNAGFCVEIVGKV